MVKETWIPQVNVEDFKKNILKINKKLTKNNLPIVNLTFDHEEVIKVKELDNYYGRGIVEKVTFYDVFMIDIPETLVVVNGWKVIAKIDNADDSVMVLSFDNEVEVDKKYFDIKNFNCEHCNINRYRVSLYILFNEETKEQKAVGGSCLKDFTGYDIFKSYGFVQDIQEIIDEYGSFNEGKSDGFDNKVVVANSIFFSENFGYVSNSNHDREGLSTKEMVYDNLIRKSDDSKKVKISDNYFDKADEIINWFKNEYNNAEGVTDYIHNLRNIINKEAVKTKYLGYLVSIYPLYQKYLASQIKKDEANETEFYGEVDNKIDVKGVTVTKVHTFESYNSFTGYDEVKTLYTFEKDSFVFVWFTSGGNPKNLEIGNVINLKGRIKKHDTYNEIKQTVLTRCSVKSA